MENYIDALERLGKLLNSGVLTKEEFDREKARLLGNSPERIPMDLRKRRKFLFSAGIAAAIVSGVGIAYAVVTSIPRTGQETVAAESQEPSVVKPSMQAAELALAFADPATCEPGSKLSALLADIRQAGAAQGGSELRAIRLVGSKEPLEVQSSSQDFVRDQVRLARLPASAVWRDMRVTALQTSEWDGGTGFQIHFATSGEHLLRTLKAEGFKLKAVSQPLAEPGHFIAIENTPAGSVLTCMKSDSHSLDEQQSDVAEDGG